MEHTNTRNVLIASAVISIAGLVGWYLYAPMRNNIAAGQNAASTSATGGSDITITGPTSTSAYKVELVSAKQIARKAPPLERPIPAAPSDLSPEARTQALANLSVTIAALRAKPDSFNDWLLLGSLRQMLGDYTGASEAWSYIASRAPKESTPYGNLGNLYAVYLKDYKKAEVNYKIAIVNDPHNPNLYRNLFDIYRSSYTPTPTAAEDTLKEGILQNATAIDLQVLLARYYRDSGRVALARATYDAAVAKAYAQGKTALEAEIETERNSL